MIKKKYIHMRTFVEKKINKYVPFILKYRNTYRNSNTASSMNSADVKVFKEKVNDNKTTESKTMEVKVVENKVSENKVSETKNTETKTFEKKVLKEEKNNSNKNSNVMTTKEKILAMSETVSEKPVLKIKKDKGLIERTESSKTILTEDNKELLKD